MSSANKAKAILKYIWYLFLIIAKSILGKIVYPFVYPLRNWCRNSVYNYENITVVPVKQKDVSKVEYIIAKIVWYFFDDSTIPQGGNFFITGERFCKGDIGKKDISEDGWNRRGYLSDVEENICNEWIAFYCAYKWNAIRNPMYNMNYSVLSNHSEIEKIWITKEAYSGSWNINRRIEIDKNTLVLKSGYESRLGTNMTWFQTKKGQNCFNYSTAYIYTVNGKRYGIEFKLGWHPNTDGRVLVNLRMYKIKDDV